MINVCTLAFTTVYPLFVRISLFTVYEAGKAVKKGVASQYAPTVYAPSMYAQPAYGGPLMNQPGIPLLPLPNGLGVAPVHNGYNREYDGTSSGETHSCLIFLS